MNLAILLPSLKPTGPIMVAKDVIEEIINNKLLKIYHLKVFYFDQTPEQIVLPCDCQKLDYNEKHYFSDFDVIHSHGYRPDRFLANNKNEIRAKMISTIHCHIFDDLRYTYNYLISLIFGHLWIGNLKKFDKIVTLTNYHQEYYSKFFSKKKMAIINNGRKLKISPISNRDNFFFKQIRDQYPNSTLIGACAAVVKLKGLDQIIRAMENDKKLIFIVIGEGSYKKNLIELAKKIGVDDRCFFLGYRANASIYIKKFDIYALPSHSEAFPLALIEATMSGVPCVCSDIPVLKEAFSDDEVSFFQNHNLEDCKSAINTAIIHGVKKAIKARERSFKMYTSSVMGINYYSEYQKLIVD